MGNAHPIRLLLAGIFMFGLLFSGLVRAEFQPFIEGQTLAEGVDAAAETVRGKLVAEGFDLVGDYAPTEGVRVLVVTNDTLLDTAAQSPRGGYGAVLSVALEQTDAGTRVSYQHPQYVAHGYRLESDNEPVFQAMARALGAIGYFGAEPISSTNLRTYQYAFGLETFEDPVDLGGFPSFDAADRQIGARADDEARGTELVYRVRIPGRNQVVYGIGMHTDDPNANGAALVQAVDHDAPRGYAFLPHPVLLDGSEAETLSLRFRMALFFPDLPMMGGDASFFKLRKAPDAINQLMIEVVDGEIEQDEPSSGGGFGTF
ncbi:hypothetical protein GM160_02380 [Guyparkeria halophila]|uniref:Uncharacterized protein n=1 Tax=Guyparkeria halophila TaxID=47960 RepID=A0A6I6D3C4_9GAMM|nr:hypothetical protein [Guyparkeria halophila]QGT77831.1 hypothetical protein GM160_02380 [Guyparkeria halophila]